jgi:hypothetical protein
MPTGLSDAGEDLCDAAVREVLGVQPAATTEIAVTGASGAGEGSGSSEVNSAGTATAVVRAVVPSVPSMVASRLPNGIRPGQSVLYHMVD